MRERERERERERKREGCTHVQVGEGQRQNPKEALIDAGLELTNPEIMTGAKQNQESDA